MKLPVFQQMVELNRSFDEVAAGLQRLQSVSFFQRDLICHALSDVEIAGVYANREFFDNFEKIVEDDAKWAYRFQRKFDQQLKDRGDIYLEVKTSEERRKRKGLAPRVVILPIGTCLTRIATTKSMQSDGQIRAERRADDARKRGGQADEKAPCRLPGSIELRSRRSLSCPTGEGCGLGRAPI